MGESQKSSRLVSPLLLFSSPFSTPLPCENDEEDDDDDDEEDELERVEGMTIERRKVS